MRCLKIQNFLRDVLLFTLQDNLKINFVIKFDTIKHITINSNNIVTLRFCLIKATQQAFNYLFSHFKYRECCLKYVANSCTLFFNQIN